MHKYQQEGAEILNKTLHRGVNSLSFTGVCKCFSSDRD